MSLFDLTANTNARKVPILDAGYPQNVTMTSTGGNATFQAVISEDGRPKKYTYQWYVNGSAVSGATAAEYVRDVSDDAGVYTVYCEVTSKAGTVRTREATLTVNRLPVLNSSYPANASAYTANTVTLKVAIATAGYPTNYTYQWYVGGSAVSGATSASYTLTVKNASYSVYCVVSNTAGKVTSRTATVTRNNTYLYKNGTVSSSIGSITITDSDVTLGTSSITMSGSGGWNTTKAVNVTNFSTFAVYVSSYTDDGSDEHSYVGVCTFDPSNYSTTDLLSKSKGYVSTKATGWRYIDISGVSGSVYIWGSTWHTTTKITQIYIA